MHLRNEWRLRKSSWWGWSWGCCYWVLATFNGFTSGRGVNIQIISAPRHRIACIITATRCRSRSAFVPFVPPVLDNKVDPDRSSSSKHQRKYETTNQRPTSAWCWCSPALLLTFDEWFIVFVGATLGIPQCCSHDGCFVLVLSSATTVEVRPFLVFSNVAFDEECRKLWAQ